MQVHFLETRRLLMSWQGRGGGGRIEILKGIASLVSWRWPLKGVWRPLPSFLFGSPRVPSLTHPPRPPQWGIRHSTTMISVFCHYLDSNLVPRAFPLLRGGRVGIYKSYNIREYVFLFPPVPNEEGKSPGNEVAWLPFRVTVYILGRTHFSNLWLLLVISGQTTRKARESRPELSPYSWRLETQASKCHEISFWTRKRNMTVFHKVFIMKYHLFSGSIMYTKYIFQ